MKKLLIIALCATIPMVGFAQKKAKKGKKTQEEVVVDLFVAIIGKLKVKGLAPLPLPI